MSVKLPDALADALGRVIAEERREWQKEAERMAAESRAVIAELRADLVEVQAELKAAVDRELERIAEAVANVKDGEPGKAGEPGPPGKDADMHEIEVLVADLVEDLLADAVASLPPAEPGPAGPPGADGKGADEELIFQMLCERVDEKIAAIPVPQDGKDGADGAHGKDGRDGLDAVSFVRDEGGGLIAVMSDGTLRDLGRIVGEKGEDGQDGLDGVSFDDMDIALSDDERTLTISAQRGDNRKEWTFRLGHVLDRGVFREGEPYAKGDGVTWSGSFWIAQEDTAEKPDSSGKGWRLAVKRGRDGKDGVVKEASKPEPIRVGKPKGNK